MSHAERAGRSRSPASRLSIRCALCAVLVACALSPAARSGAAEPSRTASSPRENARVERPAIAGRASPLAAQSAASTPAAPLPFERDSDSGAPSGWALLRGALLMAVIVAVAAAAFLRNRFRANLSLVPPGGAGWRRWLAPAAPRSLQVIQSARLTARASVHVLRWNGTDWLVGCTDHGIAVLGPSARPADGSQRSPGAEPQAPSHTSRSDRGAVGEQP